MKTGETITIYDNREVGDSSIIADGKIVQIEKKQIEKTIEETTTKGSYYAILLDSGHTLRIYADNLGEE